MHGNAIPEDPMPPPAGPSLSQRADFASLAGHELRGPLTNILALVEGMLDAVYGPLAFGQIEAMQSIEDCSRKLLRLIGDMGDLTRLEEGAARRQSVRCAIESLCEKGLKFAGESATQRQQEVISKVTPQELAVMADAGWLGKLIEEMVSCTVAAAPLKGSIELAVTTSGGNGRLLVSVTGSGPDGVASASKPPPSVGKSSVTARDRIRKLKPIGFALAERIAGEYSGVLAASVREDGAITLKTSLSLPLASPEVSAQPPPAPQPAKSEPAPASASGKSPLILLADDEVFLRSVMQNHLESVGYRVCCAGDGEEAVTKTQSERPDLVVMDLQMPRLSGLEAVRIIRSLADVKLSALPIMTLSGMAGSADQANCLAAGATACLGKPFSFKEFEQSVAALVGAPVRT